MLERPSKYGVCGRNSNSPELFIRFAVDSKNAIVDQQRWFEFGKSFRWENRVCKGCVGVLAGEKMAAK